MRSALRSYRAAELYYPSKIPANGMKRHADQLLRFSRLDNRGKICYTKMQEIMWRLAVSVNVKAAIQCII